MLNVLLRHLRVADFESEGGHAICVAAGSRFPPLRTIAFVLRDVRSISNAACRLRPHLTTCADFSQVRQRQAPRHAQSKLVLSGSLNLLRLLILHKVFKCD